MKIITITGGSLYTNCYMAYAEDSDTCVLIDPGFDAEQILEKVRAQGKTLVAVFWVLTTLFVAFECTLILGYNGALWMPFPWFREALTAFMDRITSVDATIPDLPLGAALPISAAAIIISAVGLGLEIFAALALGHSFHKHKVLLSVVFFLGIQGIYHLIGGTLPLLADLIFYFFPSQSPTGVYMLDMGGSMVFSLLWAAVLYAITHYTLKHRLNLE